MNGPLASGTIIRNYRLVQYVGGGGMGHVYRALNLSNNQTVALKLLRPELTNDPRVTQRFKREADIQARLQHPGIVRLFERVEEKGCLGIVMEFVDGPTLEAYLRSRGPLPAGEIRNLMIEIASAVDYLHCLRIVHRDLKTSNIKLPGQGRIKLLDFGIARYHNDPRLTLPGAIVGTSVYLAPEQVRGKTGSEQSDLWALGVVLYEMMSGGRLPFSGNELVDVYRRICDEPPAGLTSQDRPGYESLVPVLERCLEKKPADRYRTVADLIEALEEPAPPSRMVAVSTTGRFDRSAGIAPDRPRPLRTERRAARNERPTATWKTWLPWNYVVGAFGLFAGFFALVFILTRGSVDSVQLVGAGTSGQIDSVLIDVEGAVHADLYTPDGRYIARTPFVVKAPTGTHLEYVLRHPGYVEERIGLEVHHRRREYVITMEKVEN